MHTHIEEQVIEVEASYVDFYTHLHQHGLPYQLAILSVATPQPLCVHPAAPMAARLADEFSFQRAVPKSVMLVALRHGHVLFGIREAPDIVAELSRVPEFADAVGRPEIDAFVHVVKTQAATSRHVRDIISNLLQQPVPFVTNCLNRAVKRLLKMPKDMVTESDRLFISLSESFHNDPMCFAVYFLNRIKMKPGEAILISPEDPYCVLEGEFIEASSCSDATIIGGLSKENIHTDLFLEALSFNSSPVEVSSPSYPPFSIFLSLICCLIFKTYILRLLTLNTCSLDCVFSQTRNRFLAENDLANMVFRTFRLSQSFIC